MTELAAHYLQILVPTMLVLALAGVLTGVLYAHERFTMPAVVSIVWNLVDHRLHGRLARRSGACTRWPGARSSAPSSS